MKIRLTLNEPTQEQWQTLALLAGATNISSVKRRLQGGRGAAGQRMPGYSPAYEKRRSARGRQTRNRDLQFTGRMLGAFQVTHVEASPEGFKVTWGFTSARARVLAVAHQKRSRWVGWAPEDVTNVRGALQTYLDNE